jgi:alpha-beta hydrolase superfamily lysophospholipase
MTRKEDFTFLSADGKTQIHAVRWIPEEGSYDAVLQITHGMVEFIERYDEFARFMNDKGFLVVGHDHLGHGASITSESEWGYFADAKHPSDVVVDDMHRLRTMIQGENPTLPYYMLGHSMGSYMLRKYLCIHGEGVDGAVIMGTGCVPDATTGSGIMLCDLMKIFMGDHHRSRLMQSLSYSKPYRQFDCYGKDLSNSWLSKNVDNVRQYMNDPRCTYIFTVNGYKGLMEAVRYDNQKSNIDRTPKDLPLLIISGADDPVGDLGEGVRKVFAKYSAAGCNRVTMKLYEGDRHEILNELDRDTVYNDICSWIRTI